MSAATAARPLPHPGEPGPRRHLEIAPSRGQRRARPRLVHVVVTLGGLGAILLAQLLLSIALADGAYQISTLQGEQRGLLRDERDLSEQLEVLSSTQNLTGNAERLGMVPSGNPVFLDLATGAVSGPATGAADGTAADGNLIGNSLLDGSQLVEPPASVLPAVPSGSTDAPSGTLPSPVTH